MRETSRLPHFFVCENHAESPTIYSRSLLDIGERVTNCSTLVVSFSRKMLHIQPDFGMPETVSEMLKNLEIKGIARFGVDFPPSLWYDVRVTFM